MRLAGGFEIALACDMIVAAENARFGLPEVKRGLVAAGGGLMRLPQRVPYHVAMEWALTGDLVAGPARIRGGPGQPADTARRGAARGRLELAATIAANGPLAVRATKRILVEAPEWPAAQMFDLQRQISEPVRASEDAREGATAFKEKRAPQWRGR